MVSTIRYPLLTKEKWRYAKESKGNGDMLQQSETEMRTYRRYTDGRVMGVRVGSVMGVRVGVAKFFLGQSIGFLGQSIGKMRTIHFSYHFSSSMKTISYPACKLWASHASVCGS